MINDTIAAIATSSNEGAISIIRVSGPDSIKIANKIFKNKKLEEVPSHTIHYGHIFDEENQQNIDEVLVMIMKGPKSFTAENVVEINCHGGIFVTNKILELLLTNGARIAEAGEFSKRAFLNGRIDLSRAEAIMDIIKAKNEQSLSLAINTLDGKVSKMIENLRIDILNVIANIEVNIDYPEYDDIENITNEILLSKSIDILEKMKSILCDAKKGKILKNGIKTAIIGRPNVGKSSLLNKLMREEKAIVTNIAGTTRDIIEGNINIGGLTLNLIDTAGIRETTDIIEKIGIKKSIELIKNADLILLILNSNEPLTQKDKELINLTNSKNRIIVLNKSDLPINIELDKLDTYIKTSMIKDNDINVLEKKIKELFEIGNINSPDINFLSNSRHIAKLRQSIEAIEKSIENLKSNIPVDIVEIDLKNSWYILGEILGEEISDSLIDELFSKFCLGK